MINNQLINLNATLTANKAKTIRKLSKQSKTVTATSMLEKSKMGIKMAKVLCIMLMVESMMANGKMINQMEKVLCI